MKRCLNDWRHRPSLLMAVALTLVCCNVASHAAVRVEALQAPVWRLRGAEREAVAPGDVLYVQDRLETGPGARAVLSLSEGSTVKLGADAVFNIEELTEPADREGLFTSVLNVVRGAFRFTTAAAAKLRRRDIQARIGTATIGIRGTDVWGKSEPGRDFVVLIEGEVEIQRGTERVPLKVPGTLYAAPLGAANGVTSTATPDALAGWAAETEPTAGSGVLGKDGTYVLQLSSHRDPASASALAQRLRRAGYPVTSERIKLAGQAWTRVSLAGLMSAADAKALADVLVARFKLQSVWISRD